MSEGLAVTFRGTTTTMLFFISIYQKTKIELLPHYEHFAHMEFRNVKLSKEIGAEKICKLHLQ